MHFHQGTQPPADERTAPVADGTVVGAQDRAESGLGKRLHTRGITIRSRRCSCSTACKFAGSFPMPTRRKPSPWAGSSPSWGSAPTPGIPPRRASWWFLLQMTRRSRPRARWWMQRLAGCWRAWAASSTASSGLPGGRSPPVDGVVRTSTVFWVKVYGTR